jgi:lysophosphatidic acid phosphatase type 6
MQNYLSRVAVVGSAALFSYFAHSKYYSAEEAKLKLIKVQVVARHGARTPIAKVPNDHLIEWNNCMEVTEHSFVSPFDNADQDPIYFEKHTLDENARDTRNCTQGQLTIDGMKQMYDVGKQLYANYAPFLKDKNLVENIYARSTDVPGRRTEVSLQYVLMGMLAEAKQKPSKPIGIYMMPLQFENAYPSISACPRFNEILDDIEANDPVMKDYRKRMEPLKQKLQAIFDRVEKRTQTSEKRTESIEAIGHSQPTRKFPRWEGLHNTTTILKFHGKPLPTGFTEEDLTAIQEYIGVKEKQIWSGDYKYNNYKPREAVRLGIGRFAGDLLSTLQEAVKSYDHKNNKFHGKPFEIYLGHDTTLLPLMNAMDVYDGSWPPMGSNLALELYVSNSKEFYVSIKVGGKEKKLIPFKAFEKNLKESIPEDYALECQACLNTTVTKGTGSGV